MRRSFEHSFKITQQGTTLNQPPRTDLIAGRWGDGVLPMQIIEASGVYSFKAKIGNDLVITGYDMGSIALPGLKYKSAATVDIFGETAVPVVSMFHNYNYGNQFFCKHKARVLHANGYELFDACVMEIVAYSEPLTGDDLVKANIYFGVPEKVATAKYMDFTNGLDANAGTEALPYKTFSKINASATTGDTIYVKSGNIVNSEFWWNNTKVLNIIAIGKCNVTSAGTGYITTIAGNGKTFNGFIYDGQNTCATINETRSGFTVNYIKCLFKNELNVLLTDVGATSVTNLTDCILSSRAANTAVALPLQGCSLTGSLLNGVYTTSAGAANTANYINCNFEQTRTNRSCVTANAGIVNLKGCNFNYAQAGVGFQLKTNITYCNFNPKSTATAAISSTLYTTAELTASDNYFSDSNALADGKYFINIENGLKWDINNNHFSTSTKLAYYHIYIKNTSVLVGRSGKINYNYHLSNSFPGSIITLNSEVAYSDVNDGCEYIGNRVIGHRFNYPADATAGVHAVLLNGGKNMIIKHNYISHSGLGLVVKNGNSATAYASNGITYNLFDECVISIYVRGVLGMNIFGNTIKHSATAYGVAFAKGIVCDENSAAAGDQFAENIIIKNNIFDVKVSVGTLVSFDTHAAATCKAEDNQLFGGQYLLADGTNYSDLATAQAAGKLLNCVVGDPMLSASLIPSVALSGADLSEAYNTGLDTTSTFGSSTTLPVIVTKAQPSTWQKGAIIQ